MFRRRGFWGFVQSLIDPKVDFSAIEDRVRSARREKASALKEISAALGHALDQVSATKDHEREGTK